MAQNINLPQPQMDNNFPMYQALAQRQTMRNYIDKELDIQQISNLLWCADGVNRRDGRRTAPSAVNAQEIDIYVFNKDGVYLYEPKENALIIQLKEDHRDILCTTNKFAAKAPIMLLLVANYDKMNNRLPEETWEFYGAIDAGYISQNIYLYCAAENMATVAMGAIERKEIQNLLQFKGKAIIAHPVAFPAE